MKRSWKKSLLIGGIIFILAGCSSGAPNLVPTTIVEEGQGEVVEEMAEEQGAAEEESADVEEGDSLPEIDASVIYASSCAGCHAADRSGNRGPALLPEKLTKTPEAYTAIITNGSSPMPAFGGRLSADEINALVDFILSDPQ